MEFSPFVYEFCRLYVATILAIAAFGKALNFFTFQNNLTESFSVSARFTKPLASLLVSLELILAVILFLNTPLVKVAMYVAMLMFIGFTLVLGYYLIQDKLVRCNCFGQSNDKVTYLDLFRNGLIIVAGIIYLSGPGFGITLPSIVLLAGAACIATTLTVHLKEIVLLSKRLKEN